MNRWRVIGVLAVAASTASIGWLVTTDEFALDAGSFQPPVLRYTNADAVREAIGIPQGSAPNVFRLGTRAMERALTALPAVRSASVQVALPDRLVVTVVERMPVLEVRIGDATYLADVDGVILERLVAEAGEGLGLPAVEDRRIVFGSDLEVGGRLDAISLDAMLRLAALTPAGLGTAYATLTVSVDDDDGYVVTAHPAGWRAVFGHYTPTLRPIEIIDRQVQCLWSLVAASESGLVTIYLSPLEDRCGTYLPSPSPVASASPPPAR